MECETHTYMYILIEEKFILRNYKKIYQENTLSYIKLNIKLEKNFKYIFSKKNFKYIFNIILKNKKREGKGKAERERECVCEKRELCKGNETTTDRDPYVITGHHVKNPQHKVTKKILPFHFQFFFASIRKRKEKIARKGG